MIKTPFCGKGDCQWPHKMKEKEMNNNITVSALAFKYHPAVKRKLQYFEYKHLKGDLKDRSKIFYDAAMKIAEYEPVDFSMAIISLNKLIEAKDAFVRSVFEDKYERKFD